MAPVGHKKTELFYSVRENSPLNKSRKNGKQQIQFLSSFKPSCHCFPRWLLHKRGARVNSYKLGSANNVD